MDLPEMKYLLKKRNVNYQDEKCYCQRYNVDQRFIWNREEWYYPSSPRTIRKYEAYIGDYQCHECQSPRLRFRLAEMQGDFKYFEKKAAQSNIDISAIRDDIKTYYAFYYKKFFNSFYTYMSRECNYCLWEYTQSGQLTKGSYSDLFINNNSDKAKQLLISKARLDFTTLYYNYIFYLAFCSWFHLPSK